MSRVPLLESEHALRLRALDEVAQMHQLLLTVCAWCSRLLRSQSVVDNASCAGLSHGLCRRCDERMQVEGNLYGSH